MKKKPSNWVSASDVGRAAFCPHYLELKNKGASVNKQAEFARKQGDIKHDAFNQDAEDKRCYIASYLYGIDDPRTNSLRQFRDNWLLKFWPGKYLVNLYYALSPHLINCSRHNRTIHYCMRKTIDHVVNLVQGKDAS